MALTFCGLSGLAQAGDSTQLFPTSVTTTSQETAHPADNGFDQNPATKWRSLAPLPAGYQARADQNLLLNLVTGFSSNSFQPNLPAANDGSVATGGWIESAGGPHWVRADLGQNQFIHLISLKLKANDEVEIYGYTASKNEILLGKYLPSESYSVKHFDIGQNFIRIELRSVRPYLLYEFAATASPLFEDLTVDFGVPKNLKSVRSHFRNTQWVDSAQVWVSDDQATWQLAARPNPKSYFPTVDAVSLTGCYRYARVRCFIKKQDHARGELVDMAFFGGNTGCTIVPPPPVVWDRNAGLVSSPLENAHIVATSTNPGYPVENVLDENNATSWRSLPPYPDGYIARPDRNLLLNNGAGGQFSASSAVNAAVFTDAVTYNFQTVNQGAGNAWVRYDFPSLQKVFLISLRAGQLSSDVNIYAHKANGDSVLAATYSATDAGLERYTIDQKVTALSLVSAGSFRLYELAALPQPAWEDIVIDFQTPQEVAAVYTRYQNSNWVDSSEFQVSYDSITWTTVAKPNVKIYHDVSFLADPVLTVRYARIRSYLKNANNIRAELRKLDVRDQGGIYGAMAPAKPATRPLKDLMGTTGIFEWEQGKATELIDSTGGPLLYSRVATLGRNYQDMDWDTQDPDVTPDYDAMPGSLRFWWLDWDREYSAWKAGGLDVQACIVFNQAEQPQNVWDNPYQAAYNYGYAYARHFGPTFGTGNVEVMEIGNEPRTYDTTFYRTVLEGMAKGAYDGDSAMVVLPCALQAADPHRETSTSGNYMGARLTPVAAQFLDGIKEHHYSYVLDEKTGQRRATYPEDPRSIFREMISGLRFRDVNMPGKKFYLSEWGWDSDGGGLPCTHGECVTEQVQAIYGARGLFMLDRLGIDRSTWFKFANTNGGALYGRTGLTGPVALGSPIKKVFVNFENIKNRLGDSYFLNELHQDLDAWVMLYGDAAGNPTHVVAWRPIDANNAATLPVSVQVGLPADSAWLLDGAQAGGTPTALPSYSGGFMNMTLSATPVLIELAQPVSPIAKSAARVNPEENAGPQADVFPNPNNGRYNLQVMLPYEAKVEVRIFNTNGQQLSQADLGDLAATNHVLPLDGSSLTPGYYFVEIQLKGIGTNEAHTLRKPMLIVR